MTTFDERENAFEAHFAFEEELEFKARARRDRLVAIWAGERMGLGDAALEDYVLSVVHADLGDPGGDELYRKVLVDLSDKGVAVHPHEVREAIGRMTMQAREQLGADAGADRG